MTVEVAATDLGVVVGRTREPAWRRLTRSHSGQVGLLLTATIVLGAVAAILGLTPHDPIAQAPADRLQSPSAAYWFGTDRFGRDIFSRSIAGVANSLAVAIVAVTLSAVIGTLAGVSAGFFGGRVRAPILGIANVLFAFPPLLLALSLASSFARSWLTVAVAIAIVYVPIFVRVTRGPVLALRESDFVKAAHVLGFPASRILLRHVLPNILPIVIVQVTLSMSWAVLTEASLSYLGLGTPPPTPSLGSMVLDARTLVETAWWTMAAPGAVIVIFVVGLNLLGDGLRDALDPRHEDTA
ncbi:MAG TPA: ABC transporter permease [Patescibacteria group bacterium]|nr:ABC transporter permease [Patescibacteria group bacterium]